MRLMVKASLGDMESVILYCQCQALIYFEICNLNWPKNSDMKFSEFKQF